MLDMPVDCSNARWLDYDEPSSSEFAIHACDSSQTHLLSPAPTIPTLDIPPKSEQLISYRFPPRSESSKSSSSSLSVRQLEWISFAENNRQSSRGTVIRTTKRSYKAKLSPAFREASARVVQVKSRKSPKSPRFASEILHIRVPSPRKVGRVTSVSVKRQSYMARIESVPPLPEKPRGPPVPEKPYTSCNSRTTIANRRHRSGPAPLNLGNKTNFAIPVRKAPAPVKVSGLILNPVDAEIHRRLAIQEQEKQAARLRSVSESKVRGWLRKMTSITKLSL